MDSNVVHVVVDASGMVTKDAKIYVVEDEPMWLRLTALNLSSPSTEVTRMVVEALRTVKDTCETVENLPDKQCVALFFD